MGKIVSVGHLYQIEDFFKDPETHKDLMDFKKITVRRELDCTFNIEVE